MSLTFIDTVLFIDSSLLYIPIRSYWFFDDEERQAGAWICSSSCHVEWTNTRRPVSERLQTHDEQLTKECKHVIEG